MSESSAPTRRWWRRKKLLLVPVAGAVAATSVLGVMDTVTGHAFITPNSSLNGASNLQSGTIPVNGTAPVTAQFVSVTNTSGGALSANPSTLGVSDTPVAPSLIGLTAPGTTAILGVLVQPASSSALPILNSFSLSVTESDTAPTPCPAGSFTIAPTASSSGWYPVTTAYGSSGTTSGSQQPLPVDLTVEGAAVLYTVSFNSLSSDQNGCMGSELSFSATAA
jgi:hypothetical protein